MFTPAEAEALRDLRKSLPEGLQNRVEHDGAADLSRLQNIVATQSEADDWHASRPSLDGGPTISPEQADTLVVPDLDPGVVHRGIIAGQVTFMQWDGDGNLTAFGLLVHGDEYLIQPIDPNALGDEEDDE